MPQPTAAKDHSSSLQPSTANRAGAEDAPLISRRSFGRNAALAAAVSLAPSKLLEAPIGFEKVPVDRGKRLLDGNSPTSAHAQEVEAKLANIIRKYGDRLSDSQREHLRRILTYNEEMLASIHRFPIQNGDTPAIVLRIGFLQPTETPLMGGTSRAEASSGLPAANETED